MYRELVTCESTGECIPETFVCDGINDCAEDEDEMDCGCIPLKNLMCNRTDDSPSGCVFPEEICDGVPQCQNGEDEAPELCKEECGPDEFM